MKIKKLFSFIISALLLAGCTSPRQDDAVITYRQISMDEAVTIMSEQSGYIILDVRRPDEFAAGHIPEAVNIDVRGENFESQAQSTLDKERPVAVYCRSGARSKTAAHALAAMGYRVYELNKGFMNWNGPRTEPTE